MSGTLARASRRVILGALSICLVRAGAVAALPAAEPAAARPNRRGFDRFVGFANGAHDFERWPSERRTADSNGQPETCRVEPHDGRHLSDVLADEAVAFVRESAAADRPFALVFAPAAIHPPPNASATRRQLPADACAMARKPRSPGHSPAAKIGLSTRKFC